MKALKVKLECPSCGNILHKYYPADNIEMLKRNLVKPNIRCSCGRKGSFSILGFGDAEYELKEGKQSIAEEKENGED